MLLLILALAGCTSCGGAEAGAPAAPAPAPSPAACSPGFFTFVVNVHDFVHPSQSADTVMRVMDLYEKYDVRGDLYLTDPVVRAWEAERPDLIARLKASDMTISFHVRPPHPTYPGFDSSLTGLQGDALQAALRSSFVHYIDPTTGVVDPSREGGYPYVAKVFGRNPVTAGIPNVRFHQVGLPILFELGARATVLTHGPGAMKGSSWDRIAGLVVRPNDIDVTRIQSAGGQFWWNGVAGPQAEAFSPTNYLKAGLDGWKGQRAPFGASLIHDDDFQNRGATSWTGIYFEDKEKKIPKKPPFDLNAPEMSHPRPAEAQAALWRYYEELVAYASKNLQVITSEDLVKMADKNENAPTWCGGGAR